MHTDLAGRIGTIQNEVDEIHRKLKLLGRKLVDGLDGTWDAESSKPSEYDIEIPLPIRERLERDFQDYKRLGNGTKPSLGDITDAFIIAFRQSTVSFLPGPSTRAMTPPIRQYVSLLKCVILLERAGECQEMRDPPVLSHWPSYLRLLDEVSLDGEADISRGLFSHRVEALSRVSKSSS
jgi:hypothetical protein